MQQSHRLFTAFVMFCLVAGLFAMPAFDDKNMAQAQDENPPATIKPDVDLQSEPGGELAPFYAAAADKGVPGQYIVVFKDEIGEEPAINAAATEVSAQGAAIQFVYASAIKGFAAHLTPEMVTSLRSDPRVAFIEEDQIVSIDDGSGPSVQNFQPSAPWGLDRIDQVVGTNGVFYYPTSAGTGVHAYVLDTGIRTTHTEFGGRATLDFDAITDGRNGQPDCSSHGTHVAGTIGGITYGVAKNATLHGVRVLGCDGSGYISWVIAGVDWVKQNHIKPAVANMSLGGGISAAEDNAIKAAIASGVTFVVAAGNNNENACYVSPAHVSTAITVGATDNTDRRAQFTFPRASNYGSCLDIFAPGTNIISSFNDSDTATSTISGTSMATPHVTGAAALYLAGNPTATPSVVSSFLIAQSTKNLVTDPMGSPNRLLYISNTVGSAPILLSPTANALTNDTPTLNWNTVYYAQTYQVEYAGDPLFSTSTTIGNLSEPTYTFPHLDDGKWYWRAKGVSAYGTAGPLSVVRSFIVDTEGPRPPTLKFPVIGTPFIGTPTFVWSAVSDAKAYEFSYTGDGNYTSDILTKTSHKPASIMPKGNYTWQVRARDAAGNWGSWSGSCTISIIPPTPPAPVMETLNNSFTNDTTPTLAWKSTAYAVDYHVQIDTTSTFVEPFMQDTEGVAGLNLAAGTPTLPELPQGKYYWRVQARNANGFSGRWSTPRYFTVDTDPPAAPMLKYPLKNAVVTGTPAFSWSKPIGEAGTIRYIVETDVTPGYTSALLTSMGYKPVVPLEGSGSWHVKAVDAAGNESEWSAARSITIKPATPSRPTLVSPDNGTETDITTVELKWTEAAYAATYDIWIDNVSSFASPEYRYLDVPSTIYTTATLAPGKWYWRVQARNSNGKAGPWSTPRYFSVLPAFDAQFNTNGDFENWEQHYGSLWNVAGGYLYTNTLSSGYTSSASYVTPSTNFTYTTRVRMGYNSNDRYSLGYYGLVIRGTPLFNYRNDWQTVYYFEINQYNDNNGTPSTDDDYQESCYNVWKVAGGRKYRLMPYNMEWCSGAIKFNDWNTLKVTAIGSDLKFYVNDVLMWSQRVSNGPLNGRLGVFTYYAGFDQAANPTGRTVPFQVDWATSGKPAITGRNEQVTTGQWTSSRPPLLSDE